MAEETNDSLTEFFRSDVGGERTLAIVGEVDLSVKTKLNRELADLLAEAHSPALLDLSGVTFIRSVRGQFGYGSGGLSSVLGNMLEDTKVCRGSLTVGR